MSITMSLVVQKFRSSEVLNVLNVKGLAHTGAQVLKLLIRSCFVAIGSMLVGVCIQGKPQEHLDQYRGDHSCGIAR